MGIDSENSTSAILYTTKESGEWLRENYPLGYFGIIFSFAIKVVGVISNCVILDVVRKIPTPSTNNSVVGEAGSNLRYLLQFLGNSS